MPLEEEKLARKRRSGLDRPTRGILIFTKSNESAIRLSRLLALMDEGYSPLLGTITSTHAFSQRRKTLRSLLNGSLSIVVASDLVARGMDVPDLAHVVNYDLPTSVKGYVHRVGRTARAGQHGQAWTLTADKEARWFWTAIGRGTELRRAQERKVGRYRLPTDDGHEDGRANYQRALQLLGQEVRGER